ncbi:hypothetical protein [Burkholderia vietnamiensis]|uniref:hypothetical protein n=1 Tax=Burkholderia vietnamiensis TaxID=60552 RepID=UPI0015946CB4|nr:hypothetical protein [Burkholderia vietnamiensis]
MAGSILPRVLARFFHLPSLAVKRLGDFAAVSACRRRTSALQRSIHDSAAEESSRELESLLGLRVQFDAWLESQVDRLKRAPVASATAYVQLNRLLEQIDEARIRNARAIVTLSLATSDQAIGAREPEVVKEEWGVLQTLISQSCDRAA